MITLWNWAELQLYKMNVIIFTLLLVKALPWKRNLCWVVIVYYTEAAVSYFVTVWLFPLSPTHPQGPSFSASHWPWRHSVVVLYRPTEASHMSNHAPLPEKCKSVERLRDWAHFKRQQVSLKRDTYSFSPKCLSKVDNSRFYQNIHLHELCVSTG